MLNTQWNTASVTALYEQPFIALMQQALNTHLAHFAPDDMERCSLLSIKTGSCPEDCAYCPQSGHYQTGLQREKLLPLAQVIEQASIAKANGAKRFCMGAAWRSPSKKDLPAVLDMIKAVKALGLESCVTLGMLTHEDAQQLKAAGLDYYNHNLDTSADYYSHIISTRTYQDRLQTLEHASQADINICCGGILGMGESRQDRIELLVTLANLATPPKSVPINQLIPIKGTPLENTPALDTIEFVRTIAVARIVLPTAMLRLSAGRASMSAETQTLCFLAGANSLWIGDKLLTAQNSQHDADAALFSKLGIKPAATLAPN